MNSKHKRTRRVGLLRCLLAVSVPLVSWAASISRDNYMDFIQSVYSQLSRSALHRAAEPRKYGAGEARREAAMYEARSGNRDQHAVSAMQLLRSQGAFLDTTAPTSWGSETAIEATEAYLAIRESHALSKADHQFARNLILRLEDLAPPRPLEYGAMNRSVEDGTQRRLIMLLYPDAPTSSIPSNDGLCGNDRACYTQRVWNDWAATSDTFENSIHYNGVWWVALMKWLKADEEFNVRDERSVLEQRSVKALVYRYLAQASPLGIMPTYGDSVGLNSDPGQWIRLMENWATVYRDGQFKWVAHRMFEWTAPQKAQMDQWGNITEAMMDDLMAAYAYADDSILEQRPTAGSIVTYRHAMDFKPTSQPYPLLNTYTIPDKLVLRSGWGSDDFYALVDLAPFMGHGHEDAGSVDLMTSNGSVLLAAPPYLVKDHQFHNAFILNADGFTFPNRQYSNSDKYFTDVVSKESITVPRFVDGTLGSYAQTVISPYVGQPATVTRRFFFVKNCFLWVRDEMKANAPIQATVGPAWQTIAIDRNPGANWVNTRMSTIPVADIWKPKYLMQWTNRPWDLVVIFPKTGEGTIKIDDVSQDTTHELVNSDLQNTFKYRVWNQKHVSLGANGTVMFNSVLMPHQAGVSAGDLADRFQLVLDSGSQCVLRFRHPNGESWYVGGSDTGAPIQVGPVRTDARTFVVRMRGTNIERFWYDGGSYLTSSAKH